MALVGPEATTARCTASTWSRVDRCGGVSWHLRTAGPRLLGLEVVFFLFKGCLLEVSKYIEHIKQKVLVIS